MFGINDNGKMGENTFQLRNDNKQIHALHFFTFLRKFLILCHLLRLSKSVKGQSEIVPYSPTFVESL